jgi:hypothetical protein
MQVVSRTEADTLLDELENALEDERVALRILDSQAIDAAAATKLLLDGRMRVLYESGGFEKRHQSRIKAVRDAAVQNQLLLAHARSCIRGAIAFASGAEPVGYSNTGKRPSVPPTTSAPVRVNVRG